MLSKPADGPMPSRAGNDFVLVGAAIPGAADDGGKLLSTLTLDALDQVLAILFI